MNRWTVVGVVVLTGCRSVAPPKVIPRWSLVEESRLGTREEGPASFGDIRGILVDRQQRLWVIDHSTQDVRVFDSTGRYLRTVGRRGKGPGEFEYADGLAEAPGGTIWIDDPMNQRLTEFSPEGEYVRQIGASSSGYGFLWMGGVDSTGRLWASFLSFQEGERMAKRRLRRFTPDRTRADTVDITLCSSNGPTRGSIIEGPGGGMMIPFYPTATSAVDFNGRFACIPSTATYRGFVTDLAGKDTLARFELPIGPIPIPRAERDSAVKRLLDFAEKIKAPNASASMVPTTKPVIQGIHLDDRGRIWVQRITAANATEFDLFSPAGVPIATVASPFTPSAYQRQFRGDRVYFVVSGEDDLPQVVRARLVTTP